MTVLSLDRDEMMALHLIRVIACQCYWTVAKYGKCQLQIGIKSTLVWIIALEKLLMHVVV